MKRNEEKMTKPSEHRYSNVSLDGSKKRVSLMIDINTWQQLKIMAAEEQTTTSALVTEAIKEAYGV